LREIPQGVFEGFPLKGCLRGNPSRGFPLKKIETMNYLMFYLLLT